VNISSKQYDGDTSLFLFSTIIYRSIQLTCGITLLYLVSTFSTAGRTIRTGLVASHIVSSWTWAATLLQSSNVAWQYGVSGPFWYVFEVCAVPVHLRLKIHLC
jgi:Na+/proline symporter